MMEEKRSRRQFTREFKVEAVELLLRGDRRSTPSGAGRITAPLGAEAWRVVRRP